MNITNQLQSTTAIKKLPFRFQLYTDNANNKSLSFVNTKTKIVK